MSKIGFLIAILAFSSVWLSCGQDSPNTNSAPATNLLTNITAAEAKQHIGANVTVTGTIAEVNKAERLVRLNFDKPFPKQPFTAVIFASNTNLFPEIEKLNGKKVEVNGKITEYRDRPQIVIISTNQIKVLEGDGKSSEKAP